MERHPRNGFASPAPARSRWIGLGVLALLLAPWLGACGNDQPPECKRAAGPEFTFQVVGAHSDSFDVFTASVEGVREFPGDDPPSWTYTLRTPAPDNRQIQLSLPEAPDSLPVNRGELYTWTVHQVQGNPTAYGLKITDEQGLRYLAVNDWQPNFSIFKNGYGTLNPGGPLRVYFGDAGCDPIAENSQCYLLKKNYNLQFLIGPDLKAKLWNREESVLGGWRIQVQKAQRIQVKLGCQTENQISFFVERDGLRTP